MNTTRLAATLLALLPGGAAHAAPPGCIATSDHIACELRTVARNGGKPMQVTVPVGSHLRLYNRSGAPLQVDQVTGRTGERQRWGEFCLYLNDFRSPPGQREEAGIGEVACSFKNVGEDYAPLQLGTTDAAITVQPGDVLYLHSHLPAGPVPHTYSIAAAPAGAKSVSIRFPAIDAVIPCSGDKQHTPWTPRRNDGPATWTVTAATVYAHGGGTDHARRQVDAACVYVLDREGKLSQRHCSDRLRARGRTRLAGIEVAPGESLVAQASHVCARAEGTWDHAIWLFTRAR